MERLLLVLLVVLYACSNNATKSNSLESMDKCTQFDTICNFKICHGKRYIFLKDSMKLKPNEEAFTIIKLKNDSVGTILGWDIELLRISRNDSILFNFPQNIGFDIPQNMTGFNKLIDSYIKSVKLYPIKLDYQPEPCSIGLCIIFKNSEN